MSQIQKSGEAGKRLDRLAPNLHTSADPSGMVNFHHRINYECVAENPCNAKVTSIAGTYIGEVAAAGTID